MSRLLNPIGMALLLLLALLASACFFTVDERERAIKVRLGEITRADYEPGLHFKAPFVDTIHKFDSRILTLDVPPEKMLTSENKNVIVDFFVKWKIADPAQFYKRFGPIESRANARLSQLGNDAVRNAFKQRTIREVVSSARSKLTAEISSAMTGPTQLSGIDIVDVRVKKVELPDDVQESVYRRMETERAKIAREIRSRGEESSKEIKANANRVREETLARAYAEAEQTRGNGDAESARIYAEAYTKNPEFYSLYRSLNAYREAFSGSNNVLLLQPDSEFFRYFNNPTAAAPPK